VRFVCAGHQCGRPWPTAWKTQRIIGSRRFTPPGESLLDFLADLAFAIRRLTPLERLVVDLWGDSTRAPHKPRSSRRYDVAAALRARGHHDMTGSRAQEIFDGASEQLRSAMAETGGE
jgi:hypothetical protein